VHWHSLKRGGILFSVKKYVLISVGVALLGVIFVLAITLIAFRSTVPIPIEQKSPQEISSVEYMMLNIHGVEVRAEVVDTPKDRNTGLSGRESLAEGKGMLFIFEDVDTHSFWMPDMRFALDIIWLDENMKVVYIKENATPESYPELFIPSTPAKYVLEVPSGFSKEEGINVGDQAIIQ
jgi:uncharacterized protein